MGRYKTTDWVTDFEHIFPDIDVEVLGTYAVRLALEYIAKQVGAETIVTGLNLEDILAQCFYNILQGNIPPEFPIRRLAQVGLWDPLYQCPKKIIDGCFPK